MSRWCSNQLSYAPGVSIKPQNGRGRILTQSAPIPQSHGSARGGVTEFGSRVPTECRVDLVLWRHAEAEDAYPDMARKLTARGKKDAARMAEWLRGRLPSEVTV